MTIGNCKLGDACRCVSEPQLCPNWYTPPEAESQWRARVLAAWEPLARGFAAYPLNESAIAPLRHLCREFDAALFAGFALYAAQRDRELSGGSRSRPPSTPINLEELDL